MILFLLLFFSSSSFSNSVRKLGHVTKTHLLTYLFLLNSFLLDFVLVVAAAAAVVVVVAVLLLLLRVSGKSKLKMSLIFVHVFADSILQQRTDRILKPAPMTLADSGHSGLSLRQP